MNHSASANHRTVPFKVCGADWYLQHSPYVYYNEHCIVFNGEHIPMKIDKSAFEKLLDFVWVFSRYFVGSNADLPIVGVFHPHADKHHIKKENIGLIEVMGLAVLPSRLKKELSDLSETAWNGRAVFADEELCKHAPWLAELKKKYTFTQDNALETILQETGKVFANILEDAGVYKNTREGREAFLRFVDWMNQEM